jgi:5-methylcytosine-specific restriction endonuclease McrA
MRRINEQSGEKLDDDSALLLLARAALSASTGVEDAESLGRSSYQVVVFECHECKRAVQPAGADQVKIAAATMSAARCDAQQIDLTHGAAARDEGAAPPRATQSVPPAIRRQVLLRDQKTCQVPGCRNTLALDVHHIQPRSEGGTHGASNLLGLCSVHHRAVHQGELHVSGSAPAHLSFQHADGTPYGGPVSAPRADVCKKVFDGLCWLGFKSNEARRALDECTREGDAPLDAKSLLLEALERLG